MAWTLRLLVSWLRLVRMTSQPLTSRGDGISPDGPCPCAEMAHETEDPTLELQ